MLITIAKDELDRYGCIEGTYNDVDSDGMDIRIREISREVFEKLVRSSRREVDRILKELYNSSIL